MQRNEDTVLNLWIARQFLLATVLVAWPLASHAATFDAATLSPLWALPFAGMLLSIAIVPLVAAHFWHAHFGKVAVGWALAFLIPFAFQFGPDTALATFVHAMIEEYIPFIVLLTALFTIAGGICLHGDLRGSPRLNIALIALGTVLASLMGTTGAAMLLIRPLLRANEGRKRVVHVVIFFIFLVANVGGSLSPLGDPPLFLGFLNGVGFFWTTVHLFQPVLLVSGVLLAAFYVLDRYHFAKEARGVLKMGSKPLRIDGKINFILLVAVIVAVLISGLWNPGVSFDVYGTHAALQNIVRDVVLIVMTLISLLLTPTSARAGNAFEWAPIKEVAKLFAAIFITIAPVIGILRVGEAGAFGGIVHLVTNAAGQPIDIAYFWATGLLSSFLDNAPTYLVFFNLAGGDAQVLTTTGASTLAAISAAAVFMGAMTYIGNAPNFMVKSIAESRGIAMPGFFGFIGWSAVILLPLLILTGWIFF